jgi:hypothetical protein
MSGGKFDYMQYRIDQVADDLNQQIRRAESGEKDQYGYSLNYKPETIAKFKECEETLRRAAAMLQRVDWLLSDDDGEDNFHIRWAEEVPKSTEDKQGSAHGGQGTES